MLSQLFQVPCEALGHKGVRVLYGLSDLLAIDAASAGVSVVRYQTPPACNRTLPMKPKDATRSGGYSWDACLRQLNMNDAKLLQAPKKFPNRRVYLHDGYVYKIWKHERAEGGRNASRRLSDEHAIVERCGDMDSIPAAAGHWHEKNWEVARFRYVEGASPGCLPLKLMSKFGVIARVGKILWRLSWRGIAHNDVTLGNVVLTRDGSVFLIDFGLAEKGRRIWALYRNFARVRITTAREQGSRPFFGSLVFFSYLILKPHLPTSLLQTVVPMRRWLRCRG